jgi:hypothetical protein
MSRLPVTSGMRFRSLKPLLIATALIGTGFWLASFGWTRVRTDQQLDQDRAVIGGRVVEGATQTLSKGGQYSTLVVEYVPAQRDPITREFEVDRSTYRSALESGTVNVTYLPGDPQVARIVRFATMPYQILIGFGGVVLLSGLWCLGHFLKGESARP